VTCYSNTTSVTAQQLYTQMGLSTQVSWYAGFRYVPTGGSTCRSVNDSRLTMLPVSLFNCQTSDAMCKELERKPLWMTNYYLTAKIGTTCHRHLGHPTFGRERSECTHWVLCYKSRLPPSKRSQWMENKIKLPCCDDMYSEYESMYPRNVGI
jgi:hypothetical protein